MTGACSRIPVKTAARDLAAHTLAAAVRLAADLALGANTTIVAVGRTAEGEMIFCTTACCLHRLGTVVLVPDVDMLLWSGFPEGARRLNRNDGRTAYVLPGAESWKEVAQLTWPQALYVIGQGRFATVRDCDGMTVVLHETEAEAQVALRRMHPHGTHGKCESRHDLVVLAGPTDG